MMYLTASALLLGIALALPAAAAGEPERAVATASATAEDLDELVGKPADIAPSAYLYRADRLADQNDPEGWILVLRHAGLALDRPGPGGGGGRRCGLPKGPLLRPRRPWTSHFTECPTLCQRR